MTVNRLCIIVFALILSTNTDLNARQNTDDLNGISGNKTGRFVTEYCVFCHNQQQKTAGLDLESIETNAIGQNPHAWESVVHKLRGRQMPPSNMLRPSEEEYEAIINYLTAKLDQHAAKHPNPGRTETFRRLNRTEYKNAIRDLLALDIDVIELLPHDEASHGFDNITVGELSPTLLDRYISAAQKISRLAVGTVNSPQGETIRIRPDLTQEEHVEGLPYGTRGGVLLTHNFPRDGEYEISVRLSRDRNESVEGLHEPHQLEILLDNQRVKMFKVKPPSGKKSHAEVDQHLHVRVPVTAGPHDLGVTFIKKPSSLLETERQPFDAHFNFHRHPRISPAVYQVSINGPYNAQGPGSTPSRNAVFICYPNSPDEYDHCAETILSNLMRKAYRRPVTDTDLVKPMEFFQTGKSEGGFEAGVERALSSILVSPQFLFRIEFAPDEVKPDEVYTVSSFDLASRLSFFLWSSIPDEELFSLAERGVLHNESVLQEQVLRMLKDPKSQSLVTNFAGQWLYLRNLESTTPDLRLFPNFDDNLRQAFRKETELFFESVLREDRSVIDLIDADYTYLNERLARHYDIPHIYGSRFRRVKLEDGHHRGGLLRQGSILTVTSYATRTSPVIRGHWVLENMLGTPPPPPPPDVPALEENTVSASLPIRERLLAHRENPACASCHDVMDPLGFALENFDAVGRWRTVEYGEPIDASGEFFDGSPFENIDELETILLQHQDMFAGTLVEKLLTFALGRGIEYYDYPAIRQIVRNAKDDEYKFSSLILGIVKSTPFQMRSAP